MFCLTPLCWISPRQFAGGNLCVLTEIGTDIVQHVACEHFARLSLGNLQVGIDLPGWRETLRELSFAPNN